MPVSPPSNFNYESNIPGIKGKEPEYKLNQFYIKSTMVNGQEVKELKYNENSTKRTALQTFRESKNTHYEYYQPSLKDKFVNGEFQGDQKIIEKYKKIIKDTQKPERPGVLDSQHKKPAKKVDDRFGDL
jgi:hypothetical protein